MGRPIDYSVAREILDATFALAETDHRAVRATLCEGGATPRSGDWPPTDMAKGRVRPNDEKLRELILLISEWSQADPKFGAIKLNKLLFHSDFSAFLTFGTPITGQDYFALPQGPAPRRLMPTTKEMQRRQWLAYQEVLYYGHLQKRPIALRSAELKYFTAAEIALVRQTVEKFWKMTATEISEHSHLFLGWKAAHEGEVIPYNTALVGRRAPTDREARYGLTLQGLAESALSEYR